jgi:hypothetical protein
MDFVWHPPQTACFLAKIDLNVNDCPPAAAARGFLTTGRVHLKFLLDLATTL